MINDLQADHKWHSVCRWKAASKTLVDFLGRRRPLSGFVCTDTYRRLKVHLLGRTLLWWFQIQAFFGQPTFSWTWSTYYSLNLIYYCRECKNQLKLGSFTAVDCCLHLWWTPNVKWGTNEYNMFSATLCTFFGILHYYTSYYVPKWKFSCNLKSLIANWFNLLRPSRRW